MSFPALKSEEKKGLEPVLIVDKIGAIGEELARQLCQDFLVVLLSPNLISENAKIIHVPFKKRIPKAPDNIYSKIFIVDDGETVTRQSAFSFIEKARESNSPLFFIGSIRNTDVAHADQVVKAYEGAKVLIFGDLFDKDIFFDQEASINKFILQVKSGKIEVEGNGLSLSFPITFPDTIKLIIKASYLDIPQKIILLFYPHPITDITLANTFQKINPDIKVDFVKEKKEKEIYIPQGAEHAISKYDLESKIKELKLGETENREVKIISADLGKRSFFKPAVTLFLIFLFLLLLPFLTTSSYLVLGEWEIKNTMASLSQGEFDRAKKQINNSYTFFRMAEKTSDVLVWEAKSLQLTESAKQIKNKVRGRAMISLAGNYLFDGADIISDIYSGKSRDPKSDFSKASNSFKSAVSLIQKTRVEGNFPLEFNQDIDELMPFIDLFSSSENIIQDVLGFEKEKKYLVLFEDETILRPGGGKISKVAILKIKNARVTKFEIFDSSSVDEKLKTQIESPYILRRYTQIKNLNLENSNTSADFVNSAISSSNIYSLATSEKVDGVIALDMTFLGNLIESQKEDLLGNEDFIPQAIETLRKDLEKGNVSYFGLAKVVGKLVTQKHLLFASPTPTYQNIFIANGWSSSLWDSRGKEENKVNDYLGIVEANLGENRANFFVSRSVSKKTILENGKLSSTLTLGFSARGGSSSGGDYKNFVQLILPEETKINWISIDGQKVEIEKAITDPDVYEASNFKPPAGLEVEETNQMDKSIFGFLIIVPENSVKTVVVSYDLPYSISSEKFFNYSLKIYKQPGIESYPFDLSFSLPEEYQTIGVDKFSKEIKTDEETSFVIAQK